MSPKVFKGKSCLFGVKQGIGEYFFERTDYYGDWTFQIDANTGESQSFVEVRKRSVKAALEMQKLGVKAKDMVLLCCHNDLDSILPWFGSLFLDAIVCAVDPKQDIIDINSMIALTKPKLIFVNDSSLETIENCLLLLKHTAEIIVMGKSDKHKTISEIIETKYTAEKQFKPAKVNVKDTAFIVQSSGTTSAPKGIELSHYGFMHAVSNLPLPKLDKNVIYPEFQRTSFYSVVGAWTTVMTCARGTPKLLITDLRPVKILEYLSQYKIVDLETRQLLDANQEGEIMVKTPFRMNGYYKSNESLPLDEDGFLKSGDIGYYDEDGYFYIKDRINNRFKTKSDSTVYFINSSLIEETFLLHPDVREVSVFNIPNPLTINDMAALISVRDNSTKNLREILEFVNKGLPKGYSISKGIKLVKHLPKNLREKVPKRKCRELFFSLN